MIEFTIQDTTELAILEPNEFVYNYNEDEAKKELAYLAEIENDLHVQF